MLYIYNAPFLLLQDEMRLLIINCLNITFNNLQFDFFFIFFSGWDAKYRYCPQIHYHRPINGNRKFQISISTKNGDIRTKFHSYYMILINIKSRIN